MNGAFRRVATRVPTAAFKSPALAATKPNLSPFLAASGTRHGQVTLPGAKRCFTNVPSSRSSEADKKAKSLNKKSADEAEREVTARDDAQRKVDDRPWQREETGEHSQPATTSPDPSKGDEARGRLLTTPTRLLKLILPLPFHPDQVYINPEKEAEQKYGSEKVEPLALLVHPQQPLSYLERLIQAEIPPLQVKGHEKLPGIVFRAEADREESRDKKGPADNVASYSGLGHEAEKSNEEKNWVRWSGSTEVGDFIRDAARGREFAIDIEGHDGELRVAVPSFKDRTYYMRMRLRRMSRQINSMAELKKECDMLAHKGAHRIAQSGFGALVTWWGIVYYVTFHTEMGWDLVEPVTYLAGLTTIMGGYLWFLYMSRDLSYKAAMNVTVSRRQSALYQERGLDHGKWEHAVQEANALRREIKAVAAEYDAEWDEMKDLGGEEVKEALEQEKEGKDEKDDKQAKQDAADKAKQSK
ncbi:uncharacterized protein F5Z01DRAFT_617649 [Emericellopsis atlantica]|uniref:Calcium uniporter protein n=1 Tax=Emericellopsis atlantica TaxID=2614577 RepID=A0A9P7ZRM0_9HYPO|nr:uncharacterized protein F5Z01DRAFT_617649 [Emericellopsis atlantica]KAG9256567.1 hypothetical protein F5Z01DRAFT_617649 [Emericellopsis atlantica]